MSELVLPCQRCGRMPVDCPCGVYREAPTSTAVDEQQAERAIRRPRR